MAVSLGLPKAIRMAGCVRRLSGLLSGFLSCLLSRKGTIISYLIAFERLFRTKQTKKEPACSVVEQAGVPIDRVIGLSIDRKGLFYLLTLESIGFVSTENVDLTVSKELMAISPWLL